MSSHIGVIAWLLCTAAMLTAARNKCVRVSLSYGGIRGEDDGDHTDSCDRCDRRGGRGSHHLIHHELASGSSQDGPRKAVRGHFPFLSCSHGWTCRATIGPMLFEPPHEELSGRGDLRQYLHFDPSQRRDGFRGKLIYFSPAFCAEHLAEGLRAAGLLVIRPVRWQFCIPESGVTGKLSCHTGDHHSTISESSEATSCRATFGGRPRRRGD